MPEMDKKQLIVILAAVLLLGGCASLHQEAVIVADQKYCWESEGNLGISISGKFNSSEKMAETLNLNKEIGTFNSRKWKLVDILVSMDLNANGDVATWEVSGPKPLLSNYLEDLEAKYKDNSLFYDFGYSFVNFKPAAYWEEHWEK